jgi:hypothetical protein
MNIQRSNGWLIVVAVLMAGSRLAFGQSDAELQSKSGLPRDVLTPGEWQRVDSAVERALAWLAREQQPDGSFPTIATGQPGVTSLCLLAFMSHGHLPGNGPYGESLEKAVEFVLDSQKLNGLIARVGPDTPRIQRTVSVEVGVTSAYNHAISSLTVSEIYGLGESVHSERMKTIIGKSLVATLEMQRWPKQQPEDRGGWRYVNDFDQWDSDLSITGWELMFLRSARNAGFDVPKESIDDAVAFVRRSFSKDHGIFEYIISPADTRSRGMAGSGILALAHAGLHDSEEAKQAGEWLLRQNFEKYNQIEVFNQPAYQHDRYHYAVFNSCQGMYQLGGRYWEQFFPVVARTIVDNQQADGSWPADSHMFDAPYGNAYTTALMLLSLGAPNQMLPVLQR